MKGKQRPSAICAGFSLVEVTLAIGIFAFVAIGILGLLPAALRVRSESAQETRAVMIAGELFASIAASASLAEVVVRRGPGGEPGENAKVDLTKDRVMLGYPGQTTVPYELWDSGTGSDPEEVWETGELSPQAIENGIQTLALLHATNVPGIAGLYQVTCEVRMPASRPLSRSRPAVFSTYVAGQ